MPDIGPDKIHAASLLYNIINKVLQVGAEKTVQFILFNQASRRSVCLYLSHLSDLVRLSAVVQPFPGTFS